ncbi:DUF4236 domain-containing protein [Streptomyces mirabilis]|uniref:DUF4236 domain-containing protein n=1 Tax=Streptomyces mirabilis TaxID=68239 RepID=UPI002E340276|nr:DUF4236 domain-containing protein [Streptomyces mirabilis]
MGFSYRKTFKAGPIRISASKSGISYSAGVKGARVTKRADGRVQTTLSVPGSGLRYTETSSNRARPVAEPSAPAGPTAADLRAAYQQIYTAAVRQLRDGGSGAEIRGQLHNQGLAHPQLLKAVTDAERYLTDEAKRQAKQQAKDSREVRLNALAVEAAEALGTGMASHLVDRWLKKERGVGFLERGEVMGRAKKIHKGKA